MDAAQCMNGDLTSETEYDHTDCCDRVEDSQHKCDSQNFGGYLFKGSSEVVITLSR